MTQAGVRTTPVGAALSTSLRAGSRPYWVAQPESVRAVETALAMALLVRQA